MNRLLSLMLLLVSAHFLFAAATFADQHSRTVKTILRMESENVRSRVAVDSNASGLVAALNRDAQALQKRFWSEYRSGAVTGVAGMLLLSVRRRRAASGPCMRGRRATGAAAAAVAGALLVPSGASLAAQEAKAAHSAYAAQDFDRALAVLEDGADIESRVVRALCHAELYALYGKPHDKKAIGELRKGLGVALAVSDLAMVARLAAIGANVHGSELAAELMTTILKGASTRGDMDAVLTAVDARPGPRATVECLKAMRRHLAQLRSYVTEGGTMPVTERELCADSHTICLLVSLVDDEEAGDLARDCLVLIEDPALGALSDRQSAAALEAIERIEKARAKRARKRPGTMWHGGRE